MQELQLDKMDLIVGGEAYVPYGAISGAMLVFLLHAQKAGSLTRMGPASVFLSTAVGGFLGQAVQDGIYFALDYSYTLLVGAKDSSSVQQEIGSASLSKEQ